MNAYVFSGLKKISAKYKAELARIPDDQFQLTPPIGGWSYSEVYSHIFDASILSLLPMENCINGLGEKKPSNFKVKLLLIWGRFPFNARYKVPEKLVSRVKKITKEEAENFIGSFLEKLSADYQNIHLADKKIKALHPRLGYLSANEWLRFIQIHLNHHWKQLKRIEKSF